MSEQQHDPADQNAEAMPEGDEAPPRGWRLMAVVRWLLVAAMAAAAIASVVWYFGGLPIAKAAGASPQLYYCPMHPQVVQDHSGDCPICQMTLVLKGKSGAAMAGTAPAGHVHRDRAAHGLPAGATPTYTCPMHPEIESPDPKARCPECRMSLELKVDGAAAAPQPAEIPPNLAPIDLPPERLQLLSMRTAKATRRALAAELRMPGAVVAAEDRVAVVNARFSGWIQKLAVAQTGVKVRKGEILAVVYSPEVLLATQEFLNARSWAGVDLGGAETAANIGNATRTRLELLGLSPAEIQGLARSKKPVTTVTLRAPIEGWVTQKSAQAGAQFASNSTLFTITDLSRLWVQIDAYEADATRLQLGQTANLDIGGLRVQGKVAFLAPTLDPATRTLRVRIELDNPELRLRPGMFGHATVQVPAGEVLSVPAAAVVDTGEHQYVFVWQGDGRFTPRAVQVGLRTDAWTEVAAGLTEGETVVTDGNFLLDSESRLAATLQGMPAVSAPATAESGPDCQREFDQVSQPGKYQQCRQCEIAHRGMGAMVADCKNAIAKPWR